MTWSTFSKGELRLGAVAWPGAQAGQAAANACLDLVDYQPQECQAQANYQHLKCQAQAKASYPHECPAVRQRAVLPNQAAKLTGSISSSCTRKHVPPPPSPRKRLVILSYTT